MSRRSERRRVYAIQSGSSQLRSRSPCPTGHPGGFPAPWRVFLAKTPIKTGIPFRDSGIRERYSACLPRLLPPYGRMWTPHDLVRTPNARMWAPYDIVRTPDARMWAPYDLVRTPYARMWTSHDIIRTPHACMWTSYDTVRTPYACMWTSHGIMRPPYACMRTPHDLVRSPLPVSRGTIGRP